MVAVAGGHTGPVITDDGVFNSAKEDHAFGQHGGGVGHLEARAENVELIGKARINQDTKDGRVADVGVHGNYAYLAAFYEPKCQKGGVYVVDIADPSNPKQINFIRTANDTYVGEGVQTIHISTPQFNGDVLAYNNEICPIDATPNQHANGGMTLVDVTNPKTHKYLAEHVGDVQEDGSTNEIHSVFIWDAGNKAYAVLVDNEEATDVDIMDISDPRNPTMVAEYDLAALFPQILQPDAGLDEVFHHDMVVKEIDGRQIMFVSYWDAGYVALDVTNPAKATYVGDSDFAFPDREAAESGLDVPPEGNGHQSEPSLDNEYLVAADEDFNPYKARATTDDGGEFTAVQADDVPGVPEGGAIEGDAVYVGLACGEPAVPPGTGTGQIAVVERGVCDFQVKIDNVVAAGGYDAVLVFNREDGADNDGCDTFVTMLASSEMPAFFVQRRTGFGFFDTTYDHEACLAGDGTQTAPITIGTVGDHISMESYFDGWGYVHLYDWGAGKFEELDTYAIPEAHDPAFAEGYGDLSVHEVAMSNEDPRLAYFSYYAGGFRVARIQDDSLVETGAFIDEGGSNLWGVQVFEKNGHEYVAASDRDYGLYIFEYTGP
ncbi:MAG TPA: PA domain-containing protein [Solirubrobacterales bacterium]|nr:PA domain-containing protein [Solirubrobacterales bacterium]